MKTTCMPWFGGILLTVAGVCFYANATTINLSPLAQLKPNAANYNIKLGELRLSLSARMAVSYDDNIDRAASKDDTNEGWAVAPGLGLGVYWALSPMVTIDSDLSISYKDYINNKGEDQWSIGGADGAVAGSIHGEMLLTDVDTLKLTDTFGRTSDNLNIAAQNYPSNYALLTNTFSALYTHEFSELMAWMTQLSHTTARTNSNEYDYQNHYSDAVDSVLLWRVNENLRLGPYVRYEIMRYTEEGDPHHVNGHNDSNSRQGGLAFVYVSGGGFQVDGSVGIERLNFDTGHHPSANDDDTGLTFSLAATFATSELTTHRLYATFERYQGTLGTRVNYSKDLTLGYGITLHPVQNWTVNGNIDWLNRKESGATGEEADLVRVSLGVAYDVTPGTRLGLTLRRTGKSSDDHDREYRQNYVEFAVSHKF